MEEERWVPVKDVDLYEVSNLGRVRYKSTSHAHPSMLVRQYVKTHRGNITPQLTVALRVEEKQYYRTYHVARVVLESFTNESHRYIIFKDDNCLNCALSNLAWSDDAADAWNSKCHRDKHIEIILRYCRGESSEELSKCFNVTVHTINALLRGRRVFHRRTNKVQRVYTSGSSAKRSNFTNKDVTRIRELYFDAGVMVTDIAKMYSVATGNITYVLAGLAYDIEPDTPIRFIQNKWSNVPLTQLISHQMTSFIRTMYRKGMSALGLAKKTRVSQGILQRVLFTNEIPFEKGDSVEKLITDHNSQQRSYRTQFTKEELEHVREDIATHKYTLEQLMEKYNVTYFESREV